MKLAQLLWRLLVACAAVYLLYSAPPFLLAWVIPWLPPSIDPWFLAFAVQVAFFLVIVRVFNVPVFSALRARVNAEGLRAVFWLLSGGVLIALVFSLTAVSTSDASSTGFTTANGLRKLANEFPYSGALGGALRNFVVAPIFEELLFRVAVLSLLLGVMPTWVALLISSLLFGLGHPTPLAVLSGLAFGLLYLRYGSIWVGILAHGCWNLLVGSGVPILVAYLNEIGVIYPIQSNLLFLQAAIAALVLCCFWMFVSALRAGKRDALPLPTMTV